MSSSIAWLRYLFFAVLLFSPLVHARDNVLFTSSVTYCTPPETILIQQFDIAYFQANDSVSFNVSAASVAPNVSDSANLLLNVYGMNPVNFTIDLCSLFSGALCPLPQYNFTGAYSLELPSSIGLSSIIPEIAYYIPDLEAFAQVTLSEVGTSDLNACVQLTLSNGWSAHQKAVEWTTGAMALLSLLVAIWKSPHVESLATYRLVDLFYIFQWIASSALLNLDYPLVYISYALNFAWALGLFSATSSSPIQLSINNMRSLTGGDMEDASGTPAVAYVNRALSPYNVPSGSETVAVPSLELDVSPQVDLSALVDLTSQNLVASQVSLPQQLTSTEVQTVTSTSSNVLEAGVPIYVNSIGISTANAFMTIFLIGLMLAAIVFFVLAVGFVITFVLARKRPSDERLASWRRRYPGLARAWILRMCLIAFTPVTIFAFYQWTLKDSWLSILLSVLFFLLISGYIAFSAFSIIRTNLRSSAYTLYTDRHCLEVHGPLYGQYRTPRFYYGFVLLSAAFLRALFIAFAQTNGEVQIILCVIVEVSVLVAQLALRPHNTRGGDVLGTYLAIVRVICSGLQVAFIESLNLAPIPRVVIGIIAAVILSIAVIVMFFNILTHLGVFRILGRLIPARCRRRSRQTLPATDSSILEKGATMSIKSGESETPFNEYNEPGAHEPDMQEAHAAAPSGRSIYQSSQDVDDSGSSTLGSVSASAPRQSHPPSR